jgi:biopolymer transport protein ExbD
MTPMVDLAFLLVTFFMLTTQFRADEPVIVDTPSSISETIIPDNDVMTITIDDNGKVFYNIDGKEVIGRGTGNSESFAKLKAKQDALKKSNKK